MSGNFKSPSVTNGAKKGRGGSVKSAFTLIELAIVIAVLSALIFGAVVGGQILIRNAKFVSFFQEMQQIKKNILVGNAIYDGIFGQLSPAKVDGTELQCASGVAFSSCYSSASFSFTNSYNAASSNAIGQMIRGGYLYQGQTQLSSTTVPTVLAITSALTDAQLLSAIPSLTSYKNTGNFLTRGGFSNVFNYQTSSATAGSAEAGLRQQISSLLMINAFPLSRGTMTSTVAGYVGYLPHFTIDYAQAFSKKYSNGLAVGSDWFFGKPDVQPVGTPSQYCNLAASGDFVASATGDTGSLSGLGFVTTNTSDLQYGCTVMFGVGYGI